MKKGDTVYYVSLNGFIGRYTYKGHHSGLYYATYAEAQRVVVRHCRKLLLRAKLPYLAENLLTESRRHEKF